MTISDFMNIINITQQFLGAVFSIWSALCLISSLAIKVIPILPMSSPFLGIVKFIGKFGALNKTVNDDERLLI